VLRDRLRDKISAVLAGIIWLTVAAAAFWILFRHCGDNDACLALCQRHGYSIGEYLRGRRYTVCECWTTGKPSAPIHIPLKDR
jgi:hypothetical protein